MSEADSPTVTIDHDGEVVVITIDRPEVRNAVDGPTAALLAEAFDRFDRDDALAVAVLQGAGGTFCAGADLKGIAGGLELAIWCDLRVAASDAVFGVYCRRWGVPLVDGGTVRLPRLIGHSHAMDLILTGRGVSGAEAAAMGLANRLVDPGTALREAVALAHRLAAFPQMCLRNDRASALGQWDLPFAAAMAEEMRVGLATIASGETLQGAARFAAGEGRGGAGV
jgi:enoyl-CoA hydratase